MKEPMSAEQHRALQTAAKTALKGTLTLLGVAAFLVMEFATDISKTIGGTPKQQALGMMVLVIIPGVIMYFPLSWLVTTMLRRARR